MSAVLVTGVGVVSALGAEHERITAALREGASGVRCDPRFEGPPYSSPYAAPVEGGPRRDRDAWLLEAACAKALDDAALAADALADAALVLGVGAGVAGEPEEDADEPRAQASAAAASRVDDAGPHDERDTAGFARRLAARRPARVTELLGNQLGCGGPRLSLMTACSSSATALGVALDLLRAGRVTRAVVGGTEPLTRLTYAGFSSLRALDSRACRPFDRERAGLNLGEAAAVLVLERAEARAEVASLGAPVIALAGYGVSADAHHMTAPHPEGDGARRAMAAALDDAELEPRDIGYVNAHGTATAQGDAAEALALRALFGPAGVPVSSTKGATGHTLGAAGALEAAICVLCLRAGFMPPSVGLQQPDEQLELDLVCGAPRPLGPTATQPRCAVLSNSFAFGGTNTSIVLTAEAAR